MAKIAYILLTHKDPEGLIAQAERLAAGGDFVAIHFDGRARNADYAKLRTALDGNPSITFAKRRVKCGWGEWSLVEASLLAVEAAVEAFPRATHFYMLSGDCMPIKSAEYAHELLDREEVDYVESFDYFESDWIKTGMKEERLIYRHFFNERTQKWRFYTSYHLQQRLGLTRNVPAAFRCKSARNGGACAAERSNGFWISAAIAPMSCGFSAPHGFPMKPSFKPLCVIWFQKMKSTRAHSPA